MKAYLRSKDGSAVYQLRNNTTTVGREESDVTLPFSSIEKQHALLEFDASQGCFILQDLNSANGTYVNEHRIQNSAVRLALGDIIRFGFGNPGYEFGIEQMPPIHYQSVNTSRPWLNVLSPSSQYTSTSLPYITTGMSPIADGMSVYQGSQSHSLPTGLATSEMHGADSWGGGVMPHPPLRSRPASAGTTKPHPGSAGREHPQLATRGGWLENGTSSPNPNGQQSTGDLEERLLRMGDELSRLASYEAECHRKDGVMNLLRDEVADLKSKLGNQSYGFRAGGEESAFTNVGIVSELRQQNSHLQTLLNEKEDVHRTVTQKLANYQQQLHVKNEELNTLKNHLDAQKTPNMTKTKHDPNGTTNTLALLKTQLAEKERKVAQLTHDLDKTNKQKSQATTLMNSLQRENSAKDNVVQQVKTEIEKLKKQLREKDVTISTISAKMSRQKASKAAELAVEKIENELSCIREKLQTTEKQLRDRNKQVAELQSELERVRSTVSENRQSDRALVQELEHAKAQFLDANRTEKLLKVDMQQLEKRFDRFRKKTIQYVFSGSKKLSSNKELDDDEVLDYVKDLTQENVKLVDEIREYAEAEERAQTQKADLKEAMTALRKDMESVERHLSKHGRDYTNLEQELTKIEELNTHDLLVWIKDVMSRLLTNEMSWQKRSEEAMKRAGVDLDGSDDDGAPTVDDLCRQLKEQREKCRQLQAKIAEMEETHQEVIFKLREDTKQDEERKIARVIAEVRAEEEEKRHNTMQEMRVKEHERIREAVETERRILESQHGSVTQLQQTLNDKHHELNQHRNELAEVKTKNEQSKVELIEANERENYLKVQLQELVGHHETQMNKVVNEREELRNYKQEEVASFKEQTRQHARTIVAMEDRLLQLTKQNKQLEMELACHKHTGKHGRPLSPRKERPASPKKETSSRPQSPRKEPKQTRSVETETTPQTNTEASLKSDVYKLEHLVLLLRREAIQAKNEAQGQADIVHALRRDLAGASARMSDMASELSDKQKQKLEENEERITEQDRELEEQRQQLMQLSMLVDEQQKQIDVRETKISDSEKINVRHKKEAAKKGSKLVEYTSQLEETVEDQQALIDVIKHENKSVADLHKIGTRCRGERHDQVIARQKEALMDFRKKAKVMEQLKPPLLSHEQSLQQIVVLKNELAELRAFIANKEEDYHKSESDMHVEVRLLREQSSSNLVETNFEKKTHRETQHSLELSEKTYLKLARTLAALLEIDPIPGDRSMAHLPREEREKLEQERNKAVELMVSRTNRLYERLERKETLLGGYEEDLVNLRETQSVAGQKTAEAKGLKIDVRGRQEEIAYLRESLSRSRDDLDQQRRLNKCLQERKKFAMDYNDANTHAPSHSCYQNEITKYQDENKKRKAVEKMKRKNYEIESLKKELRSADRELNNTALKLQALESSRGLHSTPGIPELILDGV